MNCPHCGTWTMVKETRTRPEGYVRVRVCANEHKFKTVEIIQSDTNPGTPTTAMNRKRKEKQ